MAEETGREPRAAITSGAGKAYLSVAQSTAIAIQDATDNLRNAQMIAATAAGAAMAQLLATGDPKHLETLAAAQAMTTKAIEDYATVGAAASRLLADFPPEAG